MRSPGWRALRATWGNELYWSAAEWSMPTPAWDQASMVSPEQSRPALLAPAHTYGTPRYFMAPCTAARPAAWALPLLDTVMAPAPDEPAALVAWLAAVVALS